MEMKADIESGASETMQFHKIYIQRHENVRFVTVMVQYTSKEINSVEVGNITLHFFYNHLYIDWDLVGFLVVKSMKNLSSLRDLSKELDQTGVMLLKIFHFLFPLAFHSNFICSLPWLFNE